MRASQFLFDKGRPASYHPRFRKLTGSITSAIFLENFMYWDNKTKDPDGWCYKTAEEIEEETGLSYEEQKTARTRLKSLGLINEKYQRLDHKMFFQINHEKLDKLWEEVFSRTRESLVGEEGIATVGNEGLPRSINTLSHTTSLTSSSSPTGSKHKEPNERDLLKKHITEKYNTVAIQRNWFVVPLDKKIPKGYDDLLDKFIDDIDRVASLDVFCEKISALNWAEACRFPFFLRRQTFDKVMLGEWGPGNSASWTLKQGGAPPSTEESAEMRRAREEFESKRKGV